MNVVRLAVVVFSLVSALAAAATTKSRAGTPGNFKVSVTIHSGEKNDRVGEIELNGQRCETRNGDRARKRELKVCISARERLLKDAPHTTDLPWIATEHVASLTVDFKDASSTWRRTTGFLPDKTSPERETLRDLAVYLLEVAN